MATDIEAPFSATGSTATVGTLNTSKVNVDSMSAWYPSVSNGMLSWKVGSTTDTAPTPVYIKGDTGARGETGATGAAGKDSVSNYSVSLSGTTLTFTAS